MIRWLPAVLEFGLAYRFEGRRLLDDPRIGYQPLPVDPAQPQKYTADGRYSLYTYLCRDFPAADALIRRFDDIIAEWRRTGHDRDVMRRYIDLEALARR